MFSRFFLKDKINICLSFLVFLISFIVYFLTMAPTVSFWDCGEFIATSYILGVPHPPGYPLFVLIGRIFTLVPIFKEIAIRVNIISVLSSALAIGICYLIIVRIVQNCLLPSDSFWNRVGKYVGGVIGSLLIAFSSTFWFNAVEAEVLGIAMLLSMFLVYLGLLWVEQRGNLRGDMILVLISYLGLLSPAIHMTILLVMPAIFLLVIFYDKSKLSDFRFWITGLVLSLVMYAPLGWFLVMFLGWFVITFLMLMFSKAPSRWVIVFLMTLAGIVGYSVQFYIPIRAALNPAINENNPHDWKSFSTFLERKQYGQQSMAEKMFYRRGTWSHQFGTYPHMGFWGFFRQQYNLGLEKLANLTDGSFVQRLKYLLLGLPPFLFGILGIYFSIRKKPKEGIVLLLLFLLGTLGLILYMNFADGTRYDHWTGELIRLEVRDRDYFFTPGFMFFGLLVGVGVSGLLIYLSMLIQQINKKYLNYLLGILTIILMAWPISGLSDNYFDHSRKGNFLPYDYAYNLLNSCDKDAILFTNGDNDTFPLWFLQQVEKIRTDVRVVNLSLVNTNWYIKQMKNQWKVPISFTDSEIDKLGYGRTVDGKLVRIQDKMIDNILETNRWQYPVYFAVTVSSDNRIYRTMSIDSHLRMEGMAYRVVPEEGKDMIEPDIMKEKLFKVFLYRGINDPKVHKDENDKRLLNNYATMFLTLADTLKREGKFDEAILTTKEAIKRVPFDFRSYVYLGQLYVEKGERQKIDGIMSELPEDIDKASLYYNMSYIYRGAGDTNRSLEILKELLAFDPEYRLALRDIVSTYIQQKKIDELVGFLEDWISKNPTDTQVVTFLNQIKISTPRPQGELNLQKNSIKK